MGSALQGRQALVTGLSRGIGRAIIDRLLAEGARKCQPRRVCYHPRTEREREAGHA